MSKKKDDLKKQKTVVSEAVIETDPLARGGEFFSKMQLSGAMGEDLIDGFFQSKGMVEVLLDKVDKAITVIETLKKVPEYNVELAVLQAFSCTRIKALEADPRIDDWALGLEDEPTALGKDNCMKEGIDVQP